MDEVAVPHAERTHRETTVAIALFEAAEELDWAGPWEVLSVWSKGWPEDRVNVFTVADSLDPITCAKGLRVLADRTWSSLGAVDVLVYPGGRGVMAQLGDEHVSDRLRAISAMGALMTSVCTGALVYADAGLLDGRPATTHWSAVRELASLGANIDVHPDERFVDSGSVVTAAGVSAGIDMALYLVARLHSDQRARDVRRRIQYDPSPPV
jgi:transcriptional regulator GlxA family with amidase domain